MSNNLGTGRCIRKSVQYPSTLVTRGARAGAGGGGGGEASPRQPLRVRGTGFGGGSAADYLTLPY